MYGGTVRYGTVPYRTVLYGTVLYGDGAENVRSAPSRSVLVQHRFGQCRSTTPSEAATLKTKTRKKENKQYVGSL